MCCEELNSCFFALHLLLIVFFSSTYLTHASLRSSPAAVLAADGAAYLGIPQPCASGSFAAASSSQYISSPGASGPQPPPAHQSPHHLSLMSHPSAAHLHPLLHSPGLLSVGYLASAATLPTHLDSRELDSSPYNLGRSDFCHPRLRNHWFVVRRHLDCSLVVR